LTPGITAFKLEKSQAAAGHTQFLSGLDFAFGPAQEIVVVGCPAADTLKLLDPLRKMFLPRKVVLFRPAGEESPPITALAPFAKPMQAVDGRATAYVCSHFRCENPTTDPRKMVELLKKP
jgi:uncharacterized protein YyaL (SSP411 family)